MGTGRKAAVGNLVKIVQNSRLPEALRLHVGHKGRIRATGHKLVGNRASTLRLQYYNMCECGDNYWVVSQSIKVIDIA
mgnify:CR=1 FL=1